MVAKTDKPFVNATLTGLRKEAEAPEPWILGLPTAGRRVTFPDIFGMEAEEAEEFLDDLSSTSKPTTILKRWLSDEDYEHLRAERLTLRDLKLVVSSAMEYYQAQFGTEGEGGASTAS